MKNKVQMSLAAIMIAVATFLAVQLNQTFAAPTFTGDAAADFTGPSAIKIDDLTTRDVGMPFPAFPTSTVSGFDMQAFYLEYDAATDIMYVGIDCVVICGDSDGDGDPGGTSTTLADLGGEDIPDFGPGESFGLLIDTDNDYTPTSGDFDVVIGVRDDDDLSQIGAFVYTGLIGEEMVNEVWSTRLPNTVALFQSPSAAAPDLEFTIANFSTLPGFPAGQAPQRYGLHLGMGALGIDDGIGEDYAPDRIPVVITPSPMPTETPTVIPTDTPTDTPTAAPTDTPTATVTPTNPPGPTATPTNTGEPQPSPTPTLTPPPPTEVPPTGAKFATFQEWKSAQQTARLTADVQRALATQNSAFRLEIPALDLTTAVFTRGWKQVKQTDGSLVSQWEDVIYGAGWHKNSTSPGQKGNMVVSGHSNAAGSVFWNLWDLKAGETIYVDQARVRYTYVIEAVTVERETNASPAQQAENAAYLHQTEDNRLTLITCWPWNDSTHRVFVVALLKNIQMISEQR